MKKSSKLKKIISFLLVTVLVMSVIVLPVSADTAKQVTYPAGTYPDDSYHSEYEYLGNCPVYSPDELVYTGEKTTDLMNSFNLVQQYDMSFCKDTGFYMSRPFEYRSRWDHGKPAFINFGSSDSAYNQMFTKAKFDSLTTDFITENNIDMDTYDIYYLVYQDYSPTREYGYLYMDYICVPKNSRIAISNENKPDGSKDSSEIHYGLVLPASYKSVFYVESYIDGETKTVKNTPTHFAGADFWNFLGKAHHSTIATNIPIFTLKADADMYVTTGKPLNDPSNKITSKSDSTEKIGADSFYWDSLKCRIVADGQSYRVIYNYDYSVQDMIENPNSYVAYTDYTQVINYKYKNVGTYQNFETEAHSSFSLASTKSATDEVLLNRVSKSGDLQRAFLTFLDTYAASKYVDTDFSNGELLSSYIYITVTLVNIVDGGNGLAIKNKVSSDVRTFKFDAITLEEVAELNPVEEIKSDVKVDDVTDADGKVIDRTVSQITTNDNSTHTTINNYYYDSDGKRTTSSGSSLGDSLSDIASGLIKFIKTLVTEGLPAALEILKTLIKSVSDLVGFAFDQIGDIGTGTQNGIITVLKAIPTPLWGICSVGIIAYVVVGVVKKFF
jgi:hypothetical protein